MQDQILTRAGRWLAAIMLTVVMAGGALTISSPAKAYSDVSVDYFYDDLEPDGRWVNHWKYGRVWYPRDVDDDWRPYTRGRWIFTEDYGWYWESNERFGWATYHYGRWDLDEDYGWIWIPGDQWGPAWVDWRNGGGHVGWAPLPPSVVWRDDRFDYGDVDIVSVRYRPIWCFVPEASFISVNVYRHVVPPARNVTIIKNTTNITNYTVVNNTFVNKSVNVTRIENVTRTTIKPVTVVQASTPVVPTAKSGLQNLTRGQPSQIAVFRPQIAPGPRAPALNKTALPPAGQGSAAPATPANKSIVIQGQPTGQAQPLASPPATGQAAKTDVPVLPKGGFVRPQQAQPVPNSAAPPLATTPPLSSVEAARLRDLQQRQAREAASQRRQQVIERFTPSTKPRQEIQQRQASERQELQRIQENRRAVVQNRAAIPQPAAAKPQPRPAPQAQKQPPPPPPKKPGQPDQPPPH